MRWRTILSLCLLVPCQSSIAEQAPTPPSVSPVQGAAIAQSAPPLAARVIAVGIPGAGAVAPVGFFHPGGPIHDKPAFAAYTQPGRILDRRRVLVASSSNFGAPRALADAGEGAILSLDPDGVTIIVPAGFAAAGNQASALDGRVALFTAQSPAFLNALNTPGAASASQPAVSNPLGISINNAFGRLWFANTPHGPRAIGTDSIVDPAGQPLADAPSRLAGGVFAGDLTNRPQQFVPGGLRAGAVANALLGMSPDGGKRAVFAVLTSDGAIAQAHAERALDGLAPPGTISPLALEPAGDQALVTRAGMILNWVPDRILYVTDPVRHAVVALTLGGDDNVFRLRETRWFAPPELSAPVDLTPAVPEVASPAFSSNTTLAGGSDLYVVNRGNGTIVRMRQDGAVVAVRRIKLPDGSELGAGRLNGIAVSPDAQTLWVTVSGGLPGHEGSPGALLEVPAFGPGRSAMRDQDQTEPGSRRIASAGTIAQGEQLFRADFTPSQGLGPLYNARSCLECHRSPVAGGMGRNDLAVVRRVGRFDGRLFDPLVGAGGPVARAHSIAEIGVPCALAPGPPAFANLISLRNAPPLFGLGLIEAIPDAAIRAGAVVRGHVSGRAHIVRDAAGLERVGRYGWKADVAILEQFVAEAFRNELGITSPLAPTDLTHAGCGGTSITGVDDDGTSVRAVTAYIAALPLLRPHREPDKAGEAAFSATGCVACHTPALPAAGIDVPVYSDLLLHDMGPTLDDGVVQGEARGRDWRTTPLWGLGSRGRFLHDGRATSIRDAILAHDGEGAPAAAQFRKMARTEQDALLAFLSAL